jgi:hypothetical protein
MRAPAGSPGITADWLGGKPGHLPQIAESRKLAVMFSIWPGRAGTTPAAGCLPAVSTPDGYGMILIERRVDLEDATYRVI